MPKFSVVSFLSVPSPDRMEEGSGGKVGWTAIVLTCPKQEWAQILQEGAYFYLLARLYQSTGRAIAITPALAFAFALLKC